LSLRDAIAELSRTSGVAAKLPPPAFDQALVAARREPLKRTLRAATGEWVTRRSVQAAILEDLDRKPEEVGKLKRLTAGPKSEWTPSETERREIVENGRTVVANLRHDHALIAWAMERDILVRVDRTTDWGTRSCSTKTARVRKTSARCVLAGWLGRKRADAQFRRNDLRPEGADFLASSVRVAYRSKPAIGKPSLRLALASCVPARGRREGYKAHFRSHVRCDFRLLGLASWSRSPRDGCAWIERRRRARRVCGGRRPGRA
jgi:hypothetical protein